MNRRNFVKTASSLVAMSVMPNLHASPLKTNRLFDIALSQWSFHRAIFGDGRDNYEWFIKTLHSDPDSVLKGDMDPRDIVTIARKLGVEMVDLANVLWFGHAQDKPWLKQFKAMANDQGVGFTCLLCDELGYLGSPSKNKRDLAIEKHKPWIDAALELGCSQLRVNAYGEGTYLEQLEQNAESLAELAAYTQQLGLELLVENHGHPSSNGAWLAMLMEKVKHPNLGVYTDLDNFFMGGWNHSPQRRYDTIQGLHDLAPYTRGVSAKTYGFESNGQESKINYLQCMKILTAAGFTGYACAEFEGEGMSEMAGSIATISLLKQTRDMLSKA
ncbi:MAG: sugar phosphate isomerase/epimerase family protein [Paraglaciecola sp.]|uniref:sugar phosphate isomerase/epimerase family protein n=1 Tax=Paraglaciecola sp. TaxID=1920173 RepID=UPI0032972E47